MSRALGRYELLRPLARGGMAEVFLARRRAAGVEKWLVVKRMRPERAGDARFLDLFVREARLSMSLAHQNIVPVFDFGRIDDQVFLAMERVEGKDLGSSLVRAGRDRRLPALCAAFVAAECCQALDYAHRRKGPDGAPLGIVHRDVTPRNVLLSWSGEVKLTDFGIAALAGDGAARGIGTPAYMAPEQARGEPLDPRADVYAVGLVLREALTGARARAGDDRDATMTAARAGELAPWPDDVAVDPRLRAIAERASADDPAARYAGAREMLEALDAFIVAERAENKGDAPARLLAAWLGDVWQDHRDDEHDRDAIEAGPGHLVSFLDDGEHDIVGTGTAHSMALTASEAEPKREPEPVPAPPPKPAPEPIEMRPRPVRDTKLKVGWVPFVAVGVVGLVALAFATGKDTRTDAQRQEKADEDRQWQLQHPDHVIPPPHPVRAAAPTAPPSRPPSPSASPSPAPVPAASPKQKPALPSRGSAPRPPTPPSPAAHGPGSAAAAAPAQLYRVTINITPWAFFTVDDDPTKHQTIETVMLAPGAHHVHFWNDALHLQKDVTIEVPAHETSWVGKLSD